METNTQEILKKVKTTKFNYYLALAIIILIAVVIGESWHIWNLQNKIKLFPNKQIDTPNLENLIAVKGVVRTSGLSEKDEQKFGPFDSALQVTNLEDNLEPAVYRYFLLPDKANVVKGLLGKCVRIIGVIPDEWKDDNINATYASRVLMPSKIEELSYSSCQPYHNFNTIGETHLRGTVIRNQRITPSADYDYAFKLTKPVLSEIGFEDAPQDFKLLITPSKNSVWPELESQIDKETMIVGEVNKSGYIKGGNLGHFMVTDVRPLVSNRSVPSSILPKQVGELYTFDGVEYAIFLKGAMSIDLPGDTSGILYANKNDQEWKEFARIQEFSDKRNNPFVMDYQSGIFYVLIIDDFGAGSGEGVAKLLTLSPLQKVWKLESCFYYDSSTPFEGDTSRDWSTIPSGGLQKFVNEYLKVHLDVNDMPVKQYSSSEEGCSDFQLVQN